MLYDCPRWLQLHVVLLHQDVEDVRGVEGVVHEDRLGRAVGAEDLDKDLLSRGLLQLDEGQVDLFRALLLINLWEREKLS